MALTPKGERVLRALSFDHREELRMQGPILIAALERVMQVDKNASASRETETVRGKDKRQRRKAGA